MAAAEEVYRYTDPRGDTIIYKFDPTLLDSPTESPISIFHEWRQDLVSKVQWSSILLDREGAIERWKKDKKPAVGYVLWEGELGGKKARCRFVPFEKSEKGFVVDVQSR